MVPDRLRVRQDLVKGRQTRTYDPRTPNRVWITQRSWLVDHGVEAERRNQGNLLARAVQSELQDTVSLVS